MRRRQGPGVLGQVSGNLGRTPPPGVFGGCIQRAGHPLPGSLRPQRPVAGLLLDIGDQRDEPAVRQATLARDAEEHRAAANSGWAKRTSAPSRVTIPAATAVSMRSLDAVPGLAAELTQLHGGRGRHGR